MDLHDEYGHVDARTNEPLLDNLWLFLCNCETACDRTRHTALTDTSQAYGEAEYRLAREIKHRMVLLGYKPSSNNEQTERTSEVESGEDEAFGALAEKQRVDQLSVNCQWLIDKIDRIHQALCPRQFGTWQQRAEQAVEAAERRSNDINRSPWHP